MRRYSKNPIDPFSISKVTDTLGGVELNVLWVFKKTLDRQRQIDGKALN